MCMLIVHMVNPYSLLSLAAAVIICFMCAVNVTYLDIRLYLLANIDDAHWSAHWSAHCFKAMNFLIDAYVSLTTATSMLLLCACVCIGVVLRNYWLRLLSQQATQLREEYGPYHSRYSPGQYASWNALRLQQEPLLSR